LRYGGKEKVEGNGGGKKKGRRKRIFRSLLGCNLDPPLAYRH